MSMPSKKRHQGVNLHCTAVEDTPPIAMASEATITHIAQLMEHRGQRHYDSATVPAVLPRPSITILYVGPFVLDHVLERKASQWKDKLAEQYTIQVENACS